MCFYGTMQDLNNYLMNHHQSTSQTELKEMNEMKKIEFFNVNYNSDIFSLVPHQTGLLIATAMTLSAPPGPISTAQFTSCEDTSGI